MRVHSQEKPFHCPKCKYHCKWKGDLNRHLMKYHGIKVPSSAKKLGVPRLKLRKSTDVPDWEAVKQDPKRNNLSASTPMRNPDDSPLDLTVKDTFPNLYATNDPYDFESNFSSITDEPTFDIEGVNDHDSSNFKSPLQHLRDVSYNVDESSNGSLKRDHSCVLSVAIIPIGNGILLKHIRLKGCRDRFHNKACVLLTDETGRRNYEKYEKYLVDINQPPPTVFSLPSDTSSIPEGPAVPDIDTRYNNNRSPQIDNPSKSCSYDFRNIGSNFEDAP
ncbi:hypothetical protein CEXT_799611 [Caerostris extrusa]|uniref:C2H2-type domain-containing protein n=1 Tax=Caerostris extrusa TaxID=172846 RepID=A0AAV4MXK3_CAEEX|nr:hypothetical protein CEXT_799611 [Caerostris extrusa]